jgi:hypothetical protein
MHFKKKIILSFFLFLLVLISYAQTNETKSISGVIFDKTGELIIGASIKLDGANIGTISDINGKFSLNVPENGKLVISYVGYITQIVSVAGKTTFNIVL